MSREEVIKVAEFISKTGWSVFPLYEVEEGLGVSKEIILYSFSILKELEIINYQLIPWNPDTEEGFWKDRGLSQDRTKLEKVYHLNEEGIILTVTNRKLLENLISNPEKITNSILDKENYTSTLVFDEKKSVLRLGNKECRIPTSSHQFYFCKGLFAHQAGEFVTEQEILDNIDSTREEESPRLVYDAMNQLNRRVKDCFGILKMFEREANRFRIKPRSSPNN